MCSTLHTLPVLPQRHEVTQHRRLLSAPTSCRPLVVDKLHVTGPRDQTHARPGGASGCDGACDMMLNDQTPWQPGSNAVDSAAQTVWGAGGRRQWTCCWVAGSTVTRCRIKGCNVKRTFFCTGRETQALWEWNQNPQKSAACELCCFLMCKDNMWTSRIQEEEWIQEVKAF